MLINMTPQEIQEQQIINACDSLDRMDKLFEELKKATAEVERITNEIKREL